MNQARSFLVCIHDATPAFARVTTSMLRDLAPLIGRRLTLGVVPDWHGEWPLDTHREYCQHLSASSSQLLLHGFRHRRQHGSGPVSWLAEHCDELNGLDLDEALHAIGEGQRVFARAFGAEARGFLAPGWQRGRLSLAAMRTLGVDHVLGFFALDSATSSIPLATFTWDCGRWGWLGHIGHGIGRVSRALDYRIPSLAIHPRDMERGYWGHIMRLTRELIDAGYEPRTPDELLAAHHAEAAA